ncbi:hypothetical protein B0T25DRAFT_258384 [Lasiosphaeria hispida]|uniref:Uncharacterized protein n=1 Tax=Lasiosphaeria hispida TaxID=260671 RepID=A0AAJ0HGB6_9PEZI|nr:hypothetical protein B0T25DRAFT_258384 [Lasiosphaeria hispida]
MSWVVAAIEVAAPKHPSTLAPHQLHAPCPSVYDVVVLSARKAAGSALLAPTASALRFAPRPQVFRSPFRPASCRETTNATIYFASCMRSSVHGKQGRRNERWAAVRRRWETLKSTNKRRQRHPWARQGIASNQPSESQTQLQAPEVAFRRSGPAIGFNDSPEALPRKCENVGRTKCSLVFFLLLFLSEPLRVAFELHSCDRVLVALGQDRAGT